jgi:deoxyadenosine/deoxycytidine kinase
MWMVISGPDNSGKSIIAEALTKERYESKTRSVVDHKNGFFKEILNSHNYMATDIYCSRRAFGGDLFSTRSTWDNGEVFLPMARKFEEITKQEYDVLTEAYESIKGVLQAPTCFIYCKITLRQAIDRAMLKGESVDQDKLKYQIELYEKFFESVRVPVLEIDMDKKIDESLKDLYFHVDSMKATQLSDTGIWIKTVF